MILKKEKIDLYLNRYFIDNILHDIALLYSFENIRVTIFLTIKNVKQK